MLYLLHSFPQLFFVHANNHHCFLHSITQQSANLIIPVFFTLFCKKDFCELRQKREAHPFLIGTSCAYDGLLPALTHTFPDFFCYNVCNHACNTNHYKVSTRLITSISWSIDVYFTKVWLWKGSKKYTLKELSIGKLYRKLQWTGNELIGQVSQHKKTTSTKNVLEI